MKSTSGTLNEVAAERATLKDSLPFAPPSIRSILLRIALVWSSYGGAMLTALFCALTFLSIPRLTLWTAVDPSWCSVLDYSHNMGLQFGKDVVFTYGPLGFLTTDYFGGNEGALRLFTDVALCSSVAFAVCVWLWRLTIGWRCLSLALFVLLMSNSGSHDLLIDLGLLAFGLLCWFESERRVAAYSCGLVLLAVFASLAKFSFLISSAVTVAALSMEQLLRGKRRLGVAISIGFIVGLFGAWTASGQNPANFAAFVTKGWSLSSGYQAAMCLEADGAAAMSGVITAFLALLLIMLRGGGAFGIGQKNHVWRNGLLMAWLAALLFFAWKQGFVRADSLHMLIFFGFGPLLAIFVTSVPARDRRIKQWTRCLCGLTCAAAISGLQMELYPGCIEGKIPFLHAIQNGRDLARPESYRQAMSSGLKHEEQRRQLPKLCREIGGARVDVFGNRPIVAIFNRLNYTPRPLLQSYAAYNLGLMQLDEAFYASAQAPDYVLFELCPIDRRFPALEDSLLLRDLLAGGELCGEEGSFLLLKSAPLSAPPLALLRAGTVAPGGLIDVSGFGTTNLWLEIGIEPTPAGRVRQFIYKQAQVQLAVWSPQETNSQKQIFPAPAPMLAAGFVASPLLINNRDVSAFYEGKPVTRPAAYSVVLGKGGAPFWKPAIRFRIYQIGPASECRPS